jgi:hypothetical protein
MAYAEDSVLREIYNPTIPVNSTTDANAKRFRETLVPLFTCPSDFQMELIVPDSGPANADSVMFMTGSYRGNAGRGDGSVTWYLYEDVPAPNASFPNRHKGWRGPLHAVVRASGAQPPATVYFLRLEKIKEITDGTSKTMLAGESTNVYAPRRSFWAYTHGNYVLSQPTPYAPTLYGDFTRCTNAGTYGKSNRACHSGWFSNHANGMNTANCDGSVNFLSLDTDLNVFSALGSIAGYDES